MWVPLGEYPSSRSKNITPYCPIQPLHKPYMWYMLVYISRVLSKGYLTFPFETALYETYGGCSLRKSIKTVGPCLERCIMVFPVFTQQHISSIFDEKKRIWSTFYDPFCYHRDNGGTLGMVPFIINPIYTLYIHNIYIYRVGIYRAYRLLKGFLGGLNSYGSTQGFYRCGQEQQHQRLTWHLRWGSECFSVASGGGEGSAHQNTKVNPQKLSSWWLQIFFIFTPIPGEMIQLD